jgi:hypothetical protein
MSGEFQPICPPPPPLVRPVPLDPSGRRGPTRGQAKRSRWRQTSKGFYVPSSVSDEVPEQRILEQSMRLPSGGAVTGWAACRLAGAAYFDGLQRDGRTPHPVPLLVPSDSKLRSLSTSVVSREPLVADEVTSLYGVPTTLPVRGLFDEMRRVTDPREAVVAMDMAAAAELVSIKEMRAYLGGRRSWRRSRQVARGIELASERSLSPGETRMRLIWVLDAGLPAPLVNQEVWDDHGRFLGKADIFDAEAGVFGEYDGAVHRGAGRHSSDVRREDKVRRAGLEYFTVTGPDVHDQAMVADRMLATRARALAGAGRKGWTIKPPPGWWSTDTAEDRLRRRDRFREQGFAV